MYICSKYFKQNMKHENQIRTKIELLAAENADHVTSIKLAKANMFIGATEEIKKINSKLIRNEAQIAALKWALTD